MIIFGIFVSVFMFSLIVILHELWHFGAARFFWVRVEEFGLWIPPKAKELFTDKKWTKYTLNWLPLWGFVKLTWESPNTFYVFNSDKKIYNNKDLESDILAEKSIFDRDWNEVWETHKQQILKSLQENKADYNLGNKPAWQQAIIILGWVFMNFVLAWIIFSILFFVWVKPIWVNTRIDTDLPIKLIPNYEQALEIWLLDKKAWIIINPIKWSFAEKIQLKKWDVLFNIYTCDTKMLPHVICEWWEKETWHTINNLQDLQKVLQKFKWQEVAFLINEVIHDNWEKTGWAFHWWIIPNDWKIWAYISEDVKINPDFEYKYWFVNSIKNGFYETYNQSLLTFKWIWLLVKKIFNPATPTERQEAIQQVSGPIGIVDFITNSMSAGIMFMFIIAAVISINLGVFNLLPLPALDGGRFVFITINWIIKKIFWRQAITAQLENFIHVWFFLFLIALSVLIAYNDINKIINN